MRTPRRQPHPAHRSWKPGFPGRKIVSTMPAIAATVDPDPPALLSGFSLSAEHAQHQGL